MKRTIGFSIIVWDSGEIEVQWSRKGKIKTWYANLRRTDP